MLVCLFGGGAGGLCVFREELQVEVHKDPTVTICTHAVALEQLPAEWGYVFMDVGTSVHPISEQL